MPKSNFINGLFILIIGICIGTLTGLSVSPVIQVILSSIVTLVITVLSVWYGISTSDASAHKALKYKISFVPVGLLVIGLTAGCFAGIYIRTHNLIGTEAMANHSSQQVDPAKPSNDLVRSTVLFSIGQDTCDVIRGYTGPVLISYLRTLNSKSINYIIDSIGENKPDQVKQILEKLCRPQ